MPIAGDVAIVGVGTTRFGVLHDRSYLSLLAEAAGGAVADAGLGLREVQAAWLATAEPLLAGLVGDSGAALTEAIGFAPRPVTRVSNFCTSGMEAVRGAAMAVAAGEYEVCLAVGAEKMRDVAPRASLLAKTANHTHPTLSKGRTAPGQFALVANRYLATYGYEPAMLAQVAVKNHEHATRNPKAHYRKPVTAPQVMAAARVAEPLGVLDCTPTTDGAAAVVVASRAWAQRHARRYAVVEGLGLAVTDGYFSVHYRETSDFLGFAPTRHAAAAAYTQAGITDPRSQLDVVECHDCFTITEVVNTEDLGLVGPGEGGKLLLSGATAAGGRHPGQPLGRPAVLWAPRRGHRSAHDRRNHRPGDRRGGRPSSSRRAARPGPHAWRPGGHLLRHGARRGLTRLGHQTGGRFARKAATPSTASGPPSASTTASRSTARPRTRSPSTPSFSARLIRRTAVGDWAASRCASARPSARASCGSAHARETRPRRRASSASSRVPSSSSSVAAARPISRASRCVPPPPGTIPRFTSGSPIRARPRAMTRKSMHSASSHPPPSACPQMTTTVGLASRCSRTKVAWTVSTLRALAPPPTVVVAHPSDVGAGDEDRRVGTAEQHRADGVVALQALGQHRQLVVHLLVERIHRGAVDHDLRDAGGDLDPQEVLGIHVGQEGNRKTFRAVPRSSISLASSFRPSCATCPRPSSCWMSG